MPVRGTVKGAMVAGLAIRGVAMDEGVHCECFDAACPCGASCRGLVCYEWGSVAEDNWQYLCHRCALRMVERGTAPSDLALRLVEPGSVPGARGMMGKLIRLHQKGEPSQVQIRP